MKKITLLLSFIAIGAAAFAQSQRLPLLEEGTQASCGPCAAQNPTLNALLLANPTKVVSIKYQTSWPGVDPMNAQTASEVASRVTYYGFSGVPNINFDGTVINNGAPSALTQTNIDTEYGVTSPFTIAMSHSFSSDFDSVFITMVITCTQNVTGTLKARIALVEKQINFTTAPGTNGETVFYSVMRKMFPNASGTALATSWTNGQTQTISLAGPIPFYVYNMNQLAVVGFIQDDANKSVKQAGISMPLTLPTSTEDAGITGATNINAVQCVTSVTPSVTLKNFSTHALTSCNINYQLDGGALQTLPWTGSINAGASVAFPLPTMNVSIGSHILYSYTSMPNSNNDYFLNNNSNKKTFNIIGSAAMAPLVEAFAATAFPPTSWVVDNPDGAYTWTRVTSCGGFVTTGQCSKMDFFDSPSGQIDELYAKPLDLTTSNTNVILSFDVAYAQYTTQNDKLQVMVSTNCGSTWATPYSKQGATLSTAAATTTGFVPTAAQWRTEIVDLTPYINLPNVLVKFKATSAYGNNLYVDNINIATGNSALGIQQESQSVNNINVYPNPVGDNATIEFNLTESSPVTISMSNILGESVYTNSLGFVNPGEHNLRLDTPKLIPGIYFITLTSNDSKLTKKIIVNK